MKSEIASIDKINALEREILAAPQVDLQTKNEIFAGMIARTIRIPAGTVLTGATHKTDHINILIGDITVSTDEGMRRLTGYNVLPTKAGAKRAGFAHADTMWTTICKTNLTNLAEIEDELVEESDRLQSRHPELTCNKTEKLENK